MSFSDFIAQFLDLYNRLEAELPRNKEYAIAASRRALTPLRRYSPRDEGEEILIEVAIEMFEDLIERAGGSP
jgi:hypothetical protein